MKFRDIKVRGIFFRVALSSRVFLTRENREIKATRKLIPIHVQ